MKVPYHNQVNLLLNVLPDISAEPSFALHGGTAINLFMLDMPRLSVDIDLTYTEINKRDQALADINQMLSRVKARIEKRYPGIHIQHKPNICKLIINNRGIIIKIEVNMVNRGLIDECNQLPLCQKAQEAFDTFCVIPVVPISQLYGGKICAALDRQHPRDLFDIKLLLDDSDTLNDDLRRGVIFSLICSNRPMHEMLNPNLLDQETVFNHQFIGMSHQSFSYKEFEETRYQLIEKLKHSLTSDDKQFLMSIIQLSPNWQTYDFKDYPSVKWKLANLEKLRVKQPDKYQKQLDLLHQVLNN